MSGPNLFRRENLPAPEDYYIGQGLKLKGSGVERKARCQLPGHDDHHPSLSVNVATGQFFCHACGKGGGNVLDFHIAKYGMDFVQAARELGAWAGNGHAIDSPEVLATRQHWEQEQAEAKRKRDEERAKGQAEAAAQAKKIIQAAQPANADHPYLLKKGIQPTATLRELSTEKVVEIIGYQPKEDDEPLTGRLLVAPVKVGDSLSTVELIDEAGNKSAIWRGNKTGGYWATQKLPDGDGTGLTILCGEGVATVISSTTSTGYIGVACLTHTNMVRVAVTMRERYPNATIKTLADLGIGEQSAVAAASEVGGFVAVPPHVDGVKDFNDLHQLKGTPAVKAAIEGALPPAPKEKHGEVMQSIAEIAKPQPGQGAAVLNEVRDFIRRFVAFPNDECLTAVTLWAAHTHCIESFYTTPRLLPLSTEPESGKTRLLEVLNTLVPDPMFTLSPSPATIFRTLHKGAITLLLDESDTIFQKKGKDDTNEDLRALLNAGYKRGTQIPRCVGNQHEVKMFPVYCATALAGLGDMPTTIMSRAVIIQMRRRAEEKIEPFYGRDHDAVGNAIRDRLVMWAGTVRELVAEMRPEMPAGVVDRAREVWEPLIVMAEAAGDNWPTLARQACTEMHKARSSKVSLGIRLLGDLRIIFGNDDALHTKTIISKLSDPEGSGLDADAPWSELNGGKPITVRGLASILKRYNVSPVKVTRSGESLQGYRREHLGEPWKRYLLSTPAKAVSTELPELSGRSVANRGSGTVPDVPHKAAIRNGELDSGRPSSAESSVSSGLAGDGEYIA